MSRSKLVCSLTIIAVSIALSGSSCPSGGGSGGLTGNAAAGQTKYTNSCGGCHALGSFDTTTAAGANDLHGKSSSVVNNLGSINAAMTGITLTDQEVADLKAFISAN